MAAASGPAAGFWHVAHTPTHTHMDPEPSWAAAGLGSGGGRPVPHAGRTRTPAAPQVSGWKAAEPVPLAEPRVLGGVPRGPIRVYQSTGSKISGAGGQKCVRVRTESQVLHLHA